MTEPHPISDTLRPIDITGGVMPWCEGQPVLVHLAESHDFFLPVFSTVEGLEEMMAISAIDYDSIKQIDDPIEFFESLPRRYAGERLRVMVDPYITPEGKTRYTEPVIHPKGGYHG